MNPARPHWWPAYVGIGSNLDSPTEQVQRALTELAELPKSVFTAASALYRSGPVGPADQPDYINAAAALLTRLSARDFLAALHRIEAAHGRRREGERWGPRTLDLDLLAYGSETSDTDELRLPHPRIAERNFVLLPLGEIAPHLEVPGLGSVAALAANVSRSEPEIERLNR